MRTKLIKVLLIVGVIVISWFLIAIGKECGISTSTKILNTQLTIEVPSKEDILLAVKNSPSAAWEKAKDITPTLEEIKATEMPDFSSWWDEKQKNTNDLSEKISKWWNEE